jgi:hypothetical protein
MAFDNESAEGILQAKLVFLDTSTVRRSGFGVNNVSYTKLKSLLKDGSFTLITTDITQREIAKHAREQATEAFGGFQKLRQKGHALRILSLKYDGKPLRELTEKAACDELEATVAAYFKECNAKVIPIRPDSIGRVFDSYFKKLPPFGEGEKRKEFPDAFVFDALNVYCTAENQKVYVISEDKDFATACKGNPLCIHLESVETLLDIFNTHESLSTFIRTLVKKQSAVIEAEVASQIEQAAFRMFDGTEIEALRVSDVSAKKFKLLSMGSQEATCQIKGRFEVAARIPHEGRSLFGERMHHPNPYRKPKDSSVSRHSFDFRAFLSFRFDPADPTRFDHPAIELEKDVFTIVPDDEAD